MKKLRAAVEHGITIVLTPQECQSILDQAAEEARKASGYARDLQEIKDLLQHKQPTTTDAAEPSRLPIGKREAKLQQAEHHIQSLLKKNIYSFNEFIDEARAGGATYNNIDKMLKLSPGTTAAVRQGARLQKRVVERAILACPELERQLRAIVKKSKHEPLKVVKHSKDDTGSLRFTILNKVLSESDKLPLRERISQVAKELDMPLHDVASAVGVNPTALARYVSGDNISAKHQEWIEEVFSGTYEYAQ